MKLVVISPRNKVDYLAQTIIDGLKKTDHQIFYSGWGNGEPYTNSTEEILDAGKDADFIIVLWGKIKPAHNAPGPDYSLMYKINRPEVTAYIDGAEWTYTASKQYESQDIDSLRNPKLRRGEPWINMEMYNYCKWYFKRECYPEDLQMGIIPLLFGAIDKNFYKGQPEPIDVDLFVSFGQVNTGLRQYVRDYSKTLVGKDYNVLVKYGYSYDEYLSILNRTRICVDALGGGDCNARLWELFANKCCVMFQDYNIVFPDPFTDGVNCIKFKTKEEFNDKINYYLREPDRTTEIALAGYDHLMKYHTSEARVKYLLEKLCQTK